MPKKATKKLRLAQRNRRKAKRMTPAAPPASLPPSPEPIDWGVMTVKAPKKVHTALISRCEGKRNPLNCKAIYGPLSNAATKLDDIEAWVDECALLEDQQPIAKPNEIAAWVNRVKGEIGRDRTLSQMVYEPNPLLLGQPAKGDYLYVTRPSLWARIWRRLGQLWKRRA